MYKKKQPMTQEQKDILIARLEKAREAKKNKNPNSGYYGIHPNVVAIQEDNPLSLKNVRSWIKINKDIRAELSSAIRRNIKGSIAKLADVDGYIRHMEAYLKRGDWIDPMYGVDQQNKMKYICVAKAYNSDGTVKRSINTVYDDIGLYTKEMAEEDRSPLSALYTKTKQKKTKSKMR